MSDNNIKSKEIKVYKINNNKTLIPPLHICSEWLAKTTTTKNWKSDHDFIKHLIAILHWERRHCYSACRCRCRQLSQPASQPVRWLTGERSGGAFIAINHPALRTSCFLTFLCLLHALSHILIFLHHNYYAFFLRFFLPLNFFAEDVKRGAAAECTQAKASEQEPFNSFNSFLFKKK